MAMLAEPRRKQKWTLNPRGKQWSEDSNKFGQKMLEKMGWTSGKGLGANEQGMTEHVRVKFKDDAAGIGFSKDDQDKYWTEHQENFNDLLQKLHTSEEAEEIVVPPEIKNSAELSGKSLEMKSKQSRARVHYQKFTRGKDVNKYSTKDLANIFGKKEMPEVEKPVEIVVETTEEVDVEPIGAQDTTAGVLTIKGGNMSDYFKSKFPSFHLTPRKQSKDDECDSESECERRVGFGFASPSISAIFSLEKDKLNHRMDNTPEKTPRKRKSEFYVETPSKIEVNSPESKISKNSDESDNFIPKIEENSMKKSKKKNKNEDVEAVENSVEKELNFPPKTALEEENSSSNEKKTKKKKKKNREPIECIPQASDNLGTENSLETPKKLKKSKKKGFEVENSDSPAQQSEKIEEAAGKSSEKFGFENPGLDLASPDPTPSKKSKKSKKNYEVERNSEKCPENFVFENPGLDLTSPDSSLSDKGKKSKKSYEVERNPEDFAENSDKLEGESSGNFGFENPALDLTSPDPTPSKKSKKSKKNYEIERKPESFVEKSETFVFENPALDLDSPENSKNLKMGKNKKKSVKNAENLENGGNFEIFREPGVSNEALDLSDESNVKKRVTFNDEVEYNTDFSKKKKLKRKLDKFEVENDKLKKKRMKKELVEGAAFVNEALDIETISQEILENEENERKDQKSEKRRRKRRISNLETITEIPEEERSVENSENGVNNEGNEENEVKIEETPSKKKKKDKKKERMESGVQIEENVKNDVDGEKNKENLEDNEENGENEETSPKKKAKKEKKKKSEDKEEKTEVNEENNSATPNKNRSARSKHKLKSFFAKSPVLHFNGANINEIRGYGVDV